MISFHDFAIIVLLAGVISIMVSFNRLTDEFVKSRKRKLVKEFIDTIHKQSHWIYKNYHKMEEHIKIIELSGFYFDKEDVNYIEQNIVQSDEYTIELGVNAFEFKDYCKTLVVKWRIKK